MDENVAATKIYNTIIEEYGTAFERARVTANIVSSHSEIVLLVKKNNKTYNLAPPENIRKIFQTLRETMAKTNKSTWFSTVFQYDNTGQYRYKFNYDTPPTWEKPIAEETLRNLFITDMTKYPRSDTDIPSWLADIIKVNETTNTSTNITDTETKQNKITPKNRRQAVETKIMTIIHNMICQQFGTQYDKIMMTAVIVADASEITLSLLSGDTQEDVEAPEIEGLLDDLREVTATPDGGAWLNMAVEFEGDAYKVIYDYDTQPAWYTDFTPDEKRELYTLELEWFPRQDEYIPNWLKNTVSRS